MSQSNNEAPIQLPAPIEQATVAIHSSEKAPLGVERAPRPEKAGKSAALMPPAIPLPVPSTMSVPSSPSGVVATTQTPSLTVVDDGDLIEKEWVNMAKQIVERNRDDPYKQSEELTVFKADYMKKRYNKTVKLNK